MFLDFWTIFWHAKLQSVDWRFAIRTTIVSGLRLPMCRLLMRREFLGVLEFRSDLIVLDKQISSFPTDADQPERQG